jgi:gas vesicle protein
MSSKDVLIGLLAGAAVGAVAGILYAPDKGEKTRKKIKKQTARYAEDISDSVHEFVEELKSKIENAKDEVTESAKEKVEELKKKATAASN